jgi:hypothetical protein
VRFDSRETNCDQSQDCSYERSSELVCVHGVGIGGLILFLLKSRER